MEKDTIETCANRKQFKPDLEKGNIFHPKDQTQGQLCRNTRFNVASSPRLT